MFSFIDLDSLSVVTGGKFTGTVQPQIGGPIGPCVPGPHDPIGLPRPGGPQLPPGSPGPTFPPNPGSPIA